MDYHSLPRRQLQTLCKKHGIPANSTNADMAEALAALLQPKSQSQPEKRTTRASDKSMIKEDSVSEPPQNEAVPKTRQTARRRGASSEEEGHKLASESNLENPTEGEGSRSISLRRGHVKVKSTEDVSDIPRAKSGAKTKETSIDSSDTVKLQKTCLVNTHTDRSKKKKGAVTFSDTVEVKTTEQQAEIDNSEAGLINVEPERVLRNSTRHQVVEPAPVMKKVTTRRTGTRKSISQSISSEDSKDKTEISRRTRGLSFKDSTSQSISTEDSEDKTEISRRTRGSSVKAVTVETNKGTSRSRSSKYEKENKEEHLVDSTQVEFPPPQAENVRRSRRFSILPTGNNHIQISADAEMKMSGDVNTERSSRRNRNMNLSSVAALKSKSEQVISENNKDALEAQEKPPNQRRNTFRKRHDEVIPSATVKERVPRPLRERVSSRRQENGALEKSADRDESSNKDTEMFHKSCNVEEICVSEEHMSVSCSKIVEATFVDIVDHQSENGVILPEVEEHSQNVSCQSAGKLIQEEEAEVEEHNKVAFRISSVQIQVEDASVGLEEREKTEKKESVETVTCIENPNCEAQKEQETEADIEEPNKADIEISIVKTEEEDTLASLEDDYQEQNLSCTEEDNSVQTMACIENPECEVQKEMEVEIREHFKEVNDLSGVLAETEDATFDSEDRSEEHSMCCSEDEAKEEKEESIVELFQTEMEDPSATSEIHHQEQNLFFIKEEEKMEKKDSVQTMACTENLESEVQKEQEAEAEFKDSDKELNDLSGVLTEAEDHSEEHSMFCLEDEEKVGSEESIDTVELLQPEAQSEQIDLCNVDVQDCEVDETEEVIQAEADYEQIVPCKVEVQDCEVDETEEVIQAEADYEQIVPCKVEVQDCEVHEKHTVVHSCSISDFKSPGTNSDENTHDVLYGYEAEPGPVVKVHDLSFTEKDNSVQTMACIENPECEVQKEMEVEIRELFKEVNDLSGVLAETEDATFDSEDHSEEHSMCCSEDEAKEEKEESIVELLQTEVEDDCQEQNLSCTLKEPLKKVNDLSVVLKETEDATFDSEDHSEEHIISCLEDEEKEDKEESIVELFQTEMENASATPEIHYQELNLFCIKEEEKMEKKDTVQTMVCTENLESEVEKEQEAEAEFKDSDKELNDLSGVLTEAEDHSEEHSMSCLEDEEKVGSEESIDTVELLQPEAQSEQIDLCNVDVQDCELDETEEVIQAEADYEQIVPCKVEIQDCEVHEKHTVVHSCSISDFKSTGTNSDENTHDVLYGYEAEPGPVVKVHALPVNSEHEGELLHRLTCIQDETSEDDFTGLETLFYEDTPSEHEFTGIENLFVEEGSTEPESCEIRTLFAAHEVRGVEGDEVSCDVSNISHECVKNKIRFAETSIVCSNPVTHASLSISEDSYVDSTKHDVAEQGEENSAHIEAEFDNPNKFLTASNEEEKEFTLEEAFIKYNEIKQCTPEISENKSDFAQREAANVELLEFAASEDSTEYTGVEQDEKRSPHKADECCMHLNTQHLLCQPDLCDSLIDAFYRLKIDVPSKRFSFVEREKITETNDIESNCQCKIDNIAAKEDMMNHSTQMDTQLSMYTESNPVVNNVNDSEELSFTLNLQKMVEDLVIMKMQKEEPSKTADPLGCDKQLETSEVTLSNTNHFETELTVRNELTDKVEAVEELSLTLNLQKMVEDIILSSKTETKDVKPLKSAELPESEIKPDMNNITVIDEVEVAEELSLTSAFQKTVEELILFPSIAIQMDETTESHCHGQQDSNECHVAEGHSIVKEVLDEILSGIAKEQTVTSVPTPQRSMQQIDLTLKSIRNLREMCIKQSSENATSSKRLPPATPANVKRSALKAISSNIGNTPSASGVGMNTPITKSNIRRNLLSSDYGMEQQRIVASPGHTPFVFKRDLSFHR